MSKASKTGAKGRRGTRPPRPRAAIENSDLVAVAASFSKASDSFEKWLGSITPVDRTALLQKKTLMRASPFALLRATFYRWAQQWPQACAELAGAPTVLSAGDLLVENFGTWRDRQFRLVWGMNDFDEANPLPYTQDLVRLATSARLADNLPVGGREGCAAILEGYHAGLESGGCPFVLEESNEALRALAHKEAKDHAPAFWAKKLSPLPYRTPSDARKLIGVELGSKVAPSFFTRISGLGSLGRRRVIAIGELDGGKVGREVKAVVPSAWAWAKGTSKRIYAGALLSSAVRSGDPSSAFRDNGSSVATDPAPLA